MSRFADLIKPMVVVRGENDEADFELPGRQQRAAAERFPFLVVRNGMCWHKPEAAMLRSGMGTRIVLGVTTASRYDMRLLDLLKDSADVWKARGIHFEVFNTFYFETLAEFEERIPGIGRVLQTPVIGIYEQGQPSATASGAAARQLLKQRFDLPPGEAVL